MPPDLRDPDLLAINTIRTLAMDAVQAANSGHPGTPMALAPVVYCLWQDFLRFDPEDPKAAELAVYGWLSWLQEEVVHALATSLPGG